MAAFLQALTDRPVRLGEAGSAEAGGDQPAWITDRFAILAAHPEVRGSTWPDHAEESDWRPRVHRGLGGGLSVGTVRTTTVPGAAPSSRAVGQVPRAEQVERIADAALDALLAVLALWTLVYHVSVVLRIGSDPALLLGAVVVAGAAVGWRRWTRTAAAGPSTAQEYAAAAPASDPDRRWEWAAGVLALVAAVGMALSLPWALVVCGWLGATVAGLVVAGRMVLGRRTTAPAADIPTADLPAADIPTADGRAARSGREVAVVLAWAVGLAVLSLVIRRSNPDDLYYVNLSQWVAEHGTFPIRDTLFADLRWPMTSWPPVASYDALTGAIAHPLGLRAGTVVYEVVPPLMTIAAVLALWRLLRTWRVPRVAWTLTVAIAFLMLDGTSSYASPGNLFVTRLWQGKIILLCVVVPLALVHALRYVQRPDRRGLARLAIVGTAAVGCSTTAMFLMPVIALAGVAPLARRRRAALAGFAALAAYPILAGAVTMALGGRSADDFGSRELYRFDPEWIGQNIFLTAAVGFVGVLAVLLAPLILPIPAARLTTAVLLLAVGVMFVPGVTQAAYRLVGLGPTLWRLSWGLTIGALVGVAAVRAWTLARRRWSRRVVALVAVVASVAYAVTAPPTLAPVTNTSFAAPFHWQRSNGTQQVVAWMLRTLPEDSVVLGPDGVSISVSVTTTRLKPVAPRAYFLSTLAGEPGFNAADRRLLASLANHYPGAPWRTRPSVDDLRNALNRVDVRAVCLGAESHAAIRLVRAAGFEDATDTGYYRCLVRPGAG